MAKILVVEDDDELQNLLKIELTGSHYTVEVAGSGEEALELLEITKFDLILLDVTLPGIFGRRSLQNLQGPGQRYAHLDADRQ